MRTIGPLVLALVASALVGLSPARAASESYPEKPVRVVVPYVAGGNLDWITRLVAKALTDELGQTFFVENRPGANANPGKEYDVLARAATIAMA